MKSFTCPVCKMTSYNSHDVQEGYCGNCHDWTHDRKRFILVYLRLGKECRDMFKNLESALAAATFDIKFSYGAPQRICDDKGKVIMSQHEIFQYWRNR